MKTAGFIIHLARAERRRPQVDSLLGRLPIASSVIDAVDGSTLSPEAIASVYRRQIQRPRFPFEMRKSEIGCFLSHRKVWQAIVDSGLDAGLIVEDDVDVDEVVFHGVFDFAVRHLEACGYTRFPYRAYTDKGTMVAQEGPFSLVRPKLPGLGMQMQLVGCKAARTLLEVTRIFDRPVDTTIQMEWLTGVQVLTARPRAPSP